MERRSKLQDSFTLHSFFIPNNPIREKLALTFPHMKYIFTFFLLWSQLLAQTQVVEAEWFFDSPDPGFGNGTTFNAFTPDTMISTSYQAVINSLTPGLHVWNARAKNNLGIWSHTYMRPFVVLPRDSVAHLAGAEWFWDTDPGFGQANPVSLSGSSDSATWTIALDTLPVGIHDLYVRARNIEGIWGHTYRRNTFIRAEPRAAIEKLTYFYRNPDSTSMTFTYLLSQPMHYVDLSFEPDASDLVNGEEYEFCIMAVRTDSVVSCERCVDFVYQSQDTMPPDTMPPDTMTTPIQASEASTLSLYPNPNQGQFRVQLPSTRRHIAYLTVFDMQGRKVYRQEIARSQGQEIPVNLPNPSPGVYVTVLEIGNAVRLQRMLIK